MFANQEIRYQPQPGPLTAAPPTRHFPRGRTALAPPAERHPQQGAASPAPLFLPGGSRAEAGPRVPPARPPAPAQRRDGDRRREKEGCGQGAACLWEDRGEPPGEPQHSRRGTIIASHAGVWCRARAEAAPLFPFPLLASPLPARSRGEARPGARRDAPGSGDNASPRGRRRRRCLGC